jgi:uncharacterized protein YraI
MKRGVMLMGVVAVGLIGFAGTDVVYAADGRTAYAVQLRSGPGEQFPGVTRLAKGLKIDVHGCLSDGAWCDVSWRGRRGWVPADIVAVGDDIPVTRLEPRNSPPPSVPEVTFELNSYWDNNYAQEPWYSQRERWNEATREKGETSTQIAQQ